MLSIKKVPLVVSGLVLLSIACEGDTPTSVEGQDALASRRARPAVVSTFEKDTDNWTLAGDAVGVGTGPQWNLYANRSGQGDPPNWSVQGVDAGRGMTWVFVAPAKYLGNKVYMYGGTLEFDLRQGTLNNQYSDADVILAGGNGPGRPGWTLVIDAYPVDPSTGTAYGNPGTQWTHYSIKLDPSAAWKVYNAFSGRDASGAEIEEVLRKVAAIRIRGEFSGDIDHAELDNVRMVPRDK